MKKSGIIYSDSVKNPLKIKIKIKIRIDSTVYWQIILIEINETSFLLFKTLEKIYFTVEAKIFFENVWQDAFKYSTPVNLCLKPPRNGFFGERSTIFTLIVLLTSPWKWK